MEDYNNISNESPLINNTPFNNQVSKNILYQFGTQNNIYEQQ